jgi:type I restriction enzyme, S subunit
MVQVGVPEGWVKAPVGEICRLINGRAYSKDELLREGKYPLLRVGNLFTNPNWYYSDLELEPDKYCNKGDLLYAWSASFGPHIWQGPKVIYHYHIWKIEHQEDLIARDFLRAFFQWDTEAIKREQGSGSTMLHVTKKSMEARLIPVPPRNEQAAIAAKLDTTLAAVDACRQRLDGVAAILKRFRQAVLAAATSGELTREWREENSIDGIWEEGCLHELLLSKPRNGYSPKPADQETPIRSLTLSATTTGRFKPEHFKYIDQSIPVDSHLWLTPGDILIQRANTLEYVGISAIYNGPEKTFIYPDLMMKCQANDKVDTQYLHYLLLSEIVRNYFRESATGTSGNMPKINQQIVMSAPVRWPTHDEQLEIVGRAQELFTLADQIESKLTVASTIVDRLTPALLAKAFRGELVPQDPNDEPASELLAKLKAKQSNASQVSPRRRAKHSTRRQTMSISDKDSIKAAILSLDTDRFSFDELRDQAGGDYESLKRILFELLEEQSPVVRQFFDQEAKAIKLERIRP